MLWIVETYMDKRMKPHHALGVAKIFTSHEAAAAYVTKVTASGFNFCQVMPARMAKETD